MPHREAGSSSSSYFLKHLLRGLRRGADTVDFPRSEAVISPNYQGVVIVDMQLCRGCGLCVRACPANALELLGNREDGWRMRVYHDAARSAGCASWPARPARSGDTRDILQGTRAGRG